MHCIFLQVLQSYLYLFSHIPCLHFVKLDTQLDLKIDWLIFESFVHFSTCYFLCENYRKYFSYEIWWIIKCNYFLYSTVYGSHSVMFAFIERENIFFHMYTQFSFLKFGLCFFYLSPPPKVSPILFFPKLVLFFLFL